MKLRVTRFLDGVEVTHDQLLSVTVPDNRFGEAVARAREHEQAERTASSRPDIPKNNG